MFLLALGAIALVFLVGVAVLAWIARGGDGSERVIDATGTPGSRTPSTGGTQGGPEPVLDGPAVKFAAAEQEIGGGIEAVPSDSSELTLELFADPSLGPFTDSNQGKAKAAEWGYLGGYVGAFQPDGLMAGVAQGGFFVQLETHLFRDPGGAKLAFEWFSQRYDTNSAVRKEGTVPLANQSAAWSGVGAEIESTSLKRVFHRFLFRRGNMVAMVETVGAEPFMTIDPAREIAVIVDERALGNRAAPTPTPSGGALPLAPTPVR